MDELKAGMRKCNKIWIAVSGPCCSGKSAVAKTLNTMPAVTVIEEPHPREALRAVDAGDPGAGYRLQREIIDTKFSRFQSCASKKEIVVFDRSLSEDREVFFPLHRNILGTISGEEEYFLGQQCLMYEKAIGDPALIVYLSANGNILHKRAVATGRPQWLTTSLTFQMSLYERWLQGLAPKILQVDTGVIAEESTTSLCCELLSLIASGVSSDAALEAIVSQSVGISTFSSKGVLDCRDGRKRY